MQAIFNRCLAKPTSTEKTSSILFYRELGWKKEDIGVGFDISALRANWKNIEYLYGQLAPIHNFEAILKIENCSKSYLGHIWTENKESIIQLMYLGSAQAKRILNFFEAEENGASLYEYIQPTFSPKDPEFPAWWETHKDEWERKV